MKIVIGLGNPGRKYSKTRHNVGFMIIDKLTEEHNAGSGKKRFGSTISECFIEGNKTLFVKPQTFMNASGYSAREIIEKYGCNLDDILVVIDDINLPLGKIRIRGKGSSGGHKGLKSVSDHVKTTDFARLRIGVGSDFSENQKDFVLSHFTREESKIIENALNKAREAINVWIKIGINDCMNMFNQEGTKH